MGAQPKGERRTERQPPSMTTELPTTCGAAVRSSDLFGATPASIATKRMWQEGRFENRKNNPNWKKTIGKGNKRNRLQVSPKCKRGPDHFEAVEFALVSPDGEEFRGRNIQNFVRFNAELFDADAVAWLQKGKYPGNLDCLACTGLRKVRNGVFKSWRGWTRAEAPNAQAQRPPTN